MKSDPDVEMFDGSVEPKDLNPAAEELIETLPGTVVKRVLPRDPAADADTEPGVAALLFDDTEELTLPLPIVAPALPEEEPTTLVTMAAGQALPLETAGTVPLPGLALPEAEAEPDPQEQNSVFPSSPPVSTPPPKRTRRSIWLWLGWVFATFGGALLGMFFMLLVLFAINGSLDIEHSRSMQNIEGELGYLLAEMNWARENVQSSQERLDVLEGLTVRVERAETTVADLHQEVLDLQRQNDALSESLDTLTEEFETLQETALQSSVFLERLRELLDELFSDSTIPKP